jgi:hypothetical protein
LLPFHERAAVPLCPPSASQRRCRGESYRDDSVLLESEQGSPNRDPSQKRSRAIDGIDDPAAGASVVSVLLSENALTSSGSSDFVTDRRLGGAIGVGDRCSIRLRIDPKVVGAESRQRDGVSNVSEPVSEGEVPVDL